MAFEFRIHVDSVFDSVFLGAQHLNFMDKIISHVIQMNSNPRSLNSRFADVKGSDLEASDLKVSEASNKWVSEA